MMRQALLIAACAGLVAASPAAAAAGVAVTTDQAHVSTVLGREFGFSTTITNEGARKTGRLVAHLNILSFDPDVYVDPEDWSSRRTRYLTPIAPGRSQTLTWRVKAVNGGSLAAYVAVVPQGVKAAVPVAGPAVFFTVQSRKTLNAGGVLPLATGIPALLAVLTLGVRLARRRRSGASRSASAAPGPAS